MRKLALLALLAVPAPLHAQTGVDTSGAGRIIAATTEKSEVMENLRYLGDVIGPLG